MTDQEPMERLSQPETEQVPPAEKEREHTTGQRILAWFLIVVVLFAFFGVCYWMMNYRV